MHLGVLIRVLGMEEGLYFSSFGLPYLVWAYNDLERRLWIFYRLGG